MTGLGLLTLFLSSAVAAAQDGPSAPQGPMPTFLTAQVGGRNGDEVTFMRPLFETRQIQVDGKLRVEQVAICVPISVTLDGKAVRAFGPDGKPLASAEVARRLSRLGPAVVFHEGPPDPFYLQFLRNDLVVFVVPRERFLAGPAQPPAPR